ncbi:hypothetical protein LCGC14_0205360 [marine sediment metagenome]|uniref:Outer membrane lipoprotein BamD-like domain-containing protein n=1 Tax=marine sediment metagenome TaxID=412755 RepID=A0A0F9XL18_9ZZZZ|nr:tetratricopeptide repeat protein [Phycisphaerae bacterium]HDZ44742.1 tetratricopeptide repeat protein [Phycisphaerae bacterium]
MTERAQQDDAIRKPLGLWAVGALAACVALTAPVARGQVQGGANLPSGTRVGMGPAGEDPEKEKQRRKKRFDQLITKAQKLIADEKWLRARQSLDTARTLVTDRKADVPRLRNLYQQLENYGRSVLTQANEAYDQKRYAEAIDLYQQVAHVLKGLPAAKEAQASLQTAKADPQIKAHYAAMRAAALDRQIDRIIAEASSESSDRPDDGAATRPGPSSRPSDPGGRVAAIKLLAVDKQVAVIGIMEKIQRDYGKTAVAGRIADERVALTGDEEFMGPVRRARHAEDAERALKRARLYHKGGMLAKALKYYEDVVRRYPQTAAAETAGAEADALRLELGTPAGPDDNPP